MTHLVLKDSHDSGTHQASVADQSRRLWLTNLAHRHGLSVNNHGHGRYRELRISASVPAMKPLLRQLASASWHNLILETDTPRELGELLRAPVRAQP